MEVAAHGLTGAAGNTLGAGLLWRERPDNQEMPNTNSDQSRGKWRRRWKDMTPANKMIVPFTGTIALATVIYAVVSSLQLTALIESSKINRQSLQSVQRAFISFQQVDDFGFIQRSGSGDAEEFHFFASTTNSGNTPANITAQYFSGGSCRRNLPTTNFMEPQPELAKLWAKGTHNFGEYVVPGSQFGLDKITTLSGVQTHRDNRRFYLWGWVTYRDVFPDTKLHVTEFCQMMNAIGAAPASNTAKPEWRFRFQDCSGRHNCADEQCQDYGEFLSGKSGQ